MLRKHKRLTGRFRVRVRVRVRFRVRFRVRVGKLTKITKEVVDE